MTDFRVACAQTMPAAGDVQMNVEQHLDLVRKAAPEAPEVVVFPELSLTGYELDRANELAFAMDDTRLEPLRRAANAARLTLVVGAPICLAERLYNGAFALLPGGGTMVHCKRFLGTFGEEARVDGELPPPEPDVFVPGDLPEDLALSDSPAAIAICAEANRAEHASAAAARNVRTYLACSFVIPSEYESATRNLRQRAVDHAMLVAFANFGGPSGGMNAAGGSTIWAPGGDLLARLPTAGAGVLVAVRSGGRWNGFSLYG